MRCSWSLPGSPEQRPQLSVGSVGSGQVSLSAASSDCPFFCACPSSGPSKTINVVSNSLSHVSTTTWTPSSSSLWKRKSCPNSSENSIVPVMESPQEIGVCEIDRNGYDTMTVNRIESICFVTYILLLNLELDLNVVVEGGYRTKEACFHIFS